MGIVLLALTPVFLGILRDPPKPMVQGCCFFTFETKILGCARNLGTSQHMGQQKVAKKTPSDPSPELAVLLDTQHLWLKGIKRTKAVRSLLAGGLNTQALEIDYIE